MFSSSSLAAAATAAALFSTPIIASLGKPVLFSDGLSPHVDTSFWANLASTPSTSNQWAAGLIPQRCLDEARNNGVAPGDVEVFNVIYSDCSVPFAMCRAKSASLSQADMIDLFGRLPVHERQWIQHVMAVPGGGSAYESAAVVVFQGPVGVPSVFQHEVGHAVDAYSTGTQSSTTPAFENAIVADTCVPDSYSNTNEVEDYTQVSVLELYDIVTPGGLDTTSSNWRCLLNQKNVLAGFQADTMQPGGSCTRRWADSATVTTPPSKRTAAPEPAARREGSAEMVGVREVEVVSVREVDGVAIETIPWAHRSEVTTYKNLVFNETERLKAVEEQASWASKSRRALRFARRREA